MNKKNTKRNSISTRNSTTVLLKEDFSFATNVIKVKQTAINIKPVYSLAKGI